MEFWSLNVHEQSVVGSVEERPSFESGTVGVQVSQFSWPDGGKLECSRKALCELEKVYSTRDVSLYMNY